MNAILQQGIRAAQIGDNDLAYDLLTKVIRTVPQGADAENAWLWLSGVVETPDQRRRCLESVLALNPANEVAKRGLRKLETPGRQVAPPAEYDAELWPDGRLHREAAASRSVTAGLIGSALLIAGVFFPFIRAPIVGDIPMIQVQHSGLLVLILGVLSLLLVLLSATRWLWITAFLSLALMLDSWLPNRVALKIGDFQLLSSLQFGAAMLVAGVGLQIAAAAWSGDDRHPWVEPVLGFLLAAAVFAAGMLS